MITNKSFLISKTGERSTESQLADALVAMGYKVESIPNAEKGKIKVNGEILFLNKENRAISVLYKLRAKKVRSCVLKYDKYHNFATIKPKLDETIETVRSMRLVEENKEGRKEILWNIARGIKHLIPVFDRTNIIGENQQYSNIDLSMKKHGIDKITLGLNELTNVVIVFQEIKKDAYNSTFDIAKLIINPESLVIEGVQFDKALLSKYLKPSTMHVKAEEAVEKAKDWQIFIAQVQTIIFEKKQDILNYKQQ